MFLTPSELVGYAIEAMDRSYSPYSGFRVGAALLTTSGKVYTGCNIESATHTPTVCAERTAFFKAISEGEHEFFAIAIVGGKNGVITGACPPCGVCRQVMAEFCDSSFRIYLGTDPHGRYYDEYTLSELLPFSFVKDNLNK